MKLGLTAHVAQAANAFLDGLDAEFVAVERACARQILGWKLGDGVGVAERSAHGVLSGMAAAGDGIAGVSPEDIDKK
jgi:hypothetical protein